MNSFHVLQSRQLLIVSEIGSLFGCTHSIFDIIRNTISYGIHSIALQCPVSGSISCVVDGHYFARLGSRGYGHTSREWKCES